ncbi:type II toxin-antitoxin system VapC family toxin [Ottowia testudinis]|uniref:Ribonuclease VapC n=1 Tax=Ottowia testudinis TaxID=2816950 RepID=A0A975CGE4_9BURK|nr:type II toxin-antitoxin system VapC family toxin [Ottowia testudinis]QTD45306.1 type II toxin-antitoxin system VapC family toxin [Ottowia testudinis]
MTSWPVYIDTSLWCAYCFNEPEQPAAVAWLAQAELDKAATSIWTRTEFASAVGVKLRAKAQGKPPVDTAAGERQFASALDMTPELTVIQDDFLYAARLCVDHQIAGLRAGDALHLAVALRHGCKALASLDKVMNTCAQALGLKLVNLN